MAKLRAMHAKKTVSEAASSLQEVIDSAEDVLEDVKDQSGDSVDRLRKKLTAAISNAQAKLEGLGVPESVSEAYDNTLGYVRADPWRAVAIGAVAALAITLVMRVVSDD
jgi:ElaB/YqjD/DUF883 family membrane-anchored ribosome-binding protein